MVLGLLRRLFKRRRSYTINDDDDHKNASDSVVFEKTEDNAPRLLHASPISPILWRYIFPRTPAHPSDDEQQGEAEEDTTIVSHPTPCSRHSYSRESTTSVGYGSQTTSEDSYPRLGATSMGGESAEIGAYSVVETSPVPEVREVDFSPVADRTLPPITPYRASFGRIEVRKKVPSAPLLDRDEESSPISEARFTSIWSDNLRTPAATTTQKHPFTPATLPPKTPYRANFANREIRKKPSAPPLELDKREEIDQPTAMESSSQIGESIWGSPQYSPASHNDLDSPCDSTYTPYRAGLDRHEIRKISLRRIPSAAVSGRVKAMVKFFENDSERVEIPRRLDQVSPDCMRSAPQINDCTPTPSATSHKHGTHSDLVRGISSSSDHCLRCDSYYRTPNSRRSMT